MILNYELYGKKPSLMENLQELHVKQSAEINFNDHMNNLNFRSNMHDMRDLMKSLNLENESLLNVSRSNFALNRSNYNQYGEHSYNGFGSSSVFRNMFGPTGH